MFNVYSSFIESHFLMLLASFLIAWKLNHSCSKSLQAFFLKTTGFRFGFWKSIILAFIGTFFVLYASLRGIVAFALFLIVLRALWLVELAAMTLEE